MKVPDEQVMRDLDACVAWAKGQGGDTARLGITFKNVIISEAQQAITSNEVAALLMVLPIARKYIAYIDGIFKNGAGVVPNILAIDSAEAASATTMTSHEST